MGFVRIQDIFGVQQSAQQSSNVCKGVTEAEVGDGFFSNNMQQIFFTIV
jgi:hypothetical protein